MAKSKGTEIEEVKLPATNWARGWGIAAFDYDNDGWVDLAAVGETADGKGEIRLFRNLGPTVSKTLPLTWAWTKFS